MQQDLNSFNHAVSGRVYVVYGVRTMTRTLSSVRRHRGYSMQTSRSKNSIGSDLLFKQQMRCAYNARSNGLYSEILRCTKA